VLIVVGAILGTMLVIIAKLLWKYSFVKNLATKVYDAVVFNAFIRSLVQAYIVFSTSTLLNCAMPNFTN